MRNAVPATRAGPYPRAGFSDLQLNQLMSEKPTVRPAIHYVQALRTCVAELQDFECAFHVYFTSIYLSWIYPYFTIILLFTILFKTSLSFLPSFLLSILLLSSCLQIYLHLCILNIYMLISSLFFFSPIFPAWLMKR
jgi:hypothetical protein